LSRPADKRPSILAAAETVFGSLGFDRARVSDVARAAGVADGTIYRYFESKDELLICLFEERVGPTIKTVEAAVEACGDDPRDQFTVLVETYLGCIAAEPSLAPIISLQVRQSQRFVADYDNPPLQHLLDAISRVYQRGVKQGIFRSDIHDGTVRWMVFGALDAFTLAWSLKKKLPEESLGRIASDATRILLRGLASGEYATLMPQPAAALPPKEPAVATFDPATD
jgi:TetR/AcrR family transcriptional regulator, fatty acid metabolism regulator protein